MWDRAETRHMKQPVNTTVSQQTNSFTFWQTSTEQVHNQTTISWSRSLTYTIQAKACGVPPVAGCSIAPKHPPPCCHMQRTENSKFVSCRNGDLSLAFVWDNRASFWFYCLMRRHRCGPTVHPASITAARWAQSSRNHPAAWKWLIWVDCESASAVLKTREHAEPNISGAVTTWWSS